MLPHSIAEVPAVTALPKNLLLDLCGPSLSGEEAAGSSPAEVKAEALQSAEVCKI